MPETIPRVCGAMNSIASELPEAPFAAHRDAEERAQNKEDGEVRGEGRERAYDRIGEDVEHQRGSAAPSIAEPAEDEGADEAHRQRQKQGVGDRRHPNAELLGDVLDHEGEDEKSKASSVQPR